MLIQSLVLAMFFSAGADAFPPVQIMRLPGGACAFETGGSEQLRYYYDTSAPRPFFFPVNGPAGINVVSMLHPYDPQGHGHHRGIWVAHHDVNGVDFWSDTSGARIETEKWESFEDGPEGSTAVFLHRWIDPAGNPLLRERRTITVTPLDGKELYLDLLLEFEPVPEEVTLGKTPFGFAALRVRPCMRAHAGGRVRDSEGRLNEPETHWKRNRWVDYSGPVKPGVINGAALFDHPSNPRHPSYFHVRDDGWMGAAFCYDEAYILKKDAPLKLRYRFYIHGAPDAADLEARWREYAGKDKG